MLERSPYLLNRPDMLDDPFSGILRLAEFESVVSGGFIVGGDWAVRFPSSDGLTFLVIARGRMVVRIDGERGDIEMGEGDVVLMSRGRSFILASNPDLPARPVEDFAWPAPERLILFNEGSDTVQLVGRVRVHPACEANLFTALPPHIHIAGDIPEATTMRWLVGQMVNESKHVLPGSVIAQTQLAQLLFLEVLRAYMATSDLQPPGGLRVIADPRLGPVVQRVHAEPGRSWRLDEMARLAAMSRTIFVTRFREAAGMTPRAYVTEWRMRLACRALDRGNVSMATLARDLGYATESAFSHAFKRVVGVSPTRYGLWSR